MINIGTTTMANRLGKSNSKLGAIHAGKVAINDESFLDPMTFNSSFYITYDRQITQPITFTPTLLYVHQQIVEDTLDFQDILMFDTDYILTRINTDNINLADHLTYHATFGRNISQSISLNQTIGQSRIKYINQNLTLTDIVSPQHIHRQIISQNFSLTQSFSKTSRSLWPHITDNLHLVQATIVNTPKFIFKSKSGTIFALPYPINSIIEDLNFNDTYKNISHHTFVFDVPLNQLKAFKEYLNYYRFDPFVVSNTANSWLAYLHHSKANRQVLNLFDQQTKVILDLDLLPID